MKIPLHITGHKKPDSDSICAAIAYAYLKNKLDIEAIACRLGGINNETSFILEKFNFELPLLITSAKATISEIEIDPVYFANSEDTLRYVWDLCLLHNTNTIYIKDNTNKMIGSVTLSALSKIQMQDLNITATLLSQTSSSNIVKSLKGTFIHEGKKLTNGYVRIADNEFLSRDLTNSIVVLSDNEDVIIKSMAKGCSLICISEGYIPSDFTIKMAKELGVTLISTNYNIMKIIQMIYRSIPVSLIMTKRENIVSFSANEYVEDVGKIMLKTRYQSYPVFLGDEVIGTISRYHVLSYPKKNFILVDHNELSQTVDDIEYANIVEIIDHHRIGDIETTQPIFFRNLKVGSTCTIISMLFKENNIEIPYNIAGMLCSAILSDTMNFLSPTSTSFDLDIAKELASIHNIDLNDLAKEMFKKTATIKDKDYFDILYTDFKEYQLNGYSIAIGQTNIFDFAEIENIEKEFEEFMETENKRFKYDLLMMVFTNVDGLGSKFIFIGKLKNLVKEEFDSSNELFLSRKKQIIPKIASLLKY